MKQAKWTLHIPQGEHDVASAAHHYLHHGPGPKVNSSHIQRGLETHGSLEDHLTVVADDHPLMDSHLKQVAHHVADALNLPHATILKEGGKGMQSWHIRNLNYR
jgi:hypothetical protein